MTQNPDKSDTIQFLIDVKKTEIDFSISLTGGNYFSDNLEGCIPYLARVNDLAVVVEPVAFRGAWKAQYKVNDPKRDIFGLNYISFGSDQQVIMIDNKV